MPGKNLFDKQFDEGTKLKLRIYKDYLTEWLPVFISKPKPIWNRIQILDFFSGRGKDVVGEKGSPLIAIDVVNSYRTILNASSVRIELLFNDLDRQHFEALKENISSESVHPKCTVSVQNMSFKDLLKAKLPTMTDSANLLFIDQNGISQVDQEIFNQITSLKQTDFLFFISSGYFKRFAATPEFAKYFPTLNREEISNSHYFHVHRKILEYYKTLIPAGKSYFLAPFSIRKGGNIYGLIFGSGHTLGIEKFLKVAWKMDALTGESNYDIDSDKIQVGVPSLFAELNVPKKKDLFEKAFRSKVLSGEVKTNHEAYLFALNEGFQPKHASDILKKLQTERKITADLKLISEKIHKLLDGNNPENFNNKIKLL